jgi:hypothetical protein
LHEVQPTVPHWAQASALQEVQPSLPQAAQEVPPVVAQEARANTPMEDSANRMFLMMFYSAVRLIIKSAGWGALFPELGET